MKTVILALCIFVCAVSPVYATQLVREDITLAPAAEGEWTVPMVQDGAGAQFEQGTVDFTALLANTRRYKIITQYTVSCEHQTTGDVKDIKVPAQYRFVSAKKSSQVIIKINARKLSCPRQYESIGAFAFASVDTASEERYTVSTGIIELWDLHHL